MTRLLKLSAVVVVTAATFLSCVVGCRKGPKEDYKIRVGYKANSGYQIFFVAQRKGLFEKHGVKVEGATFESTELMLQALAQGQIDATPAGNIEAIAKLHDVSPDLCKIYTTLVFDKPNAYFSVLVPPNSKMTSLADLKGKKVGTIPGATAASRLRMCLKGFVNPDDVTIVQLQPQTQLQALSVGEVAALYTMDPIVTIGQVKGLARVLIKGPENEYLFTPQANAAGLISTAITKSKPATSQRFIAAMYEAIDFMRANEAETRQILGEEAKLDTAVARQVSLIDYWKLGETQYDQVQKYIDLLVTTGVLEKPVRAQDLYLTAGAVKGI